MNSQNKLTRGYAMGAEEQIRIDQKVHKSKGWMDQYGPHAWWDWKVLSSMLKVVGSVPRKTYYPVLRMLVDDPEALERDYQSVLASQQRLLLFDSPRTKWQKSYGNFIRELEFMLTGLKPKLSEDDFHDLVVNAIAEGLDEWIGFIKPQMSNMGSLIPGFMLSGANPGSEGMKALYEGDYKDRFTWIIQLATFLVGPMKAEVEENGVLKVSISRCAMHTVVSDTEPQVFSCLYACKAACEQFLDESAPMRLTFEPNIPELDCTMRVFFRS